MHLTKHLVHKAFFYLQEFYAYIAGLTNACCRVAVLLLSLMGNQNAG